MSSGKSAVAVLALLLCGLIIFHLPQTIHGEDVVSSEHSTGVDELRRVLFEKRRVLLVTADGRDYEKVAREASSRSRWIEILPRSLASLTPAELENEILVLVGTPERHPMIEAASMDIPYSFSTDAFTVSGREFSDADDVLTMLYPNPQNPSLPLHIITGNSDEAILKQLSGRRNLFRQTGDYHVARDGKLQLMGFFTNTSSGWEIDVSRERHFQQYPESNINLGALSLYQHGLNLTNDSLMSLGKIAKQALDAAGGFTKSPVEGLTVHYYSSAEQKGLMTRRTSLSHVEMGGAPVVHVVHRKGMSAADGSAVARGALLASLGRPAYQGLLDGLAGVLSEQAYKKSMHWALRLYAAGMLPPLAELFNAQLYQKSSPLVMPVAAVSFVAFLREEYGDEWIRARYSNWRPSSAEIENLQKDWNAFLAKQPVAKKSDPILVPDGFQRGFCFAHEGYSIYNGYGSRLADEALAALAGLHTNSVSITPFSYMGNPAKPNFLNYSNRAGSETDESVIHSALEARRLGMSVMLKPHIWLGSGSWPGAIEMTSEEDWQTFFSFYRRWLRHYALLAEQHGMEMLCIGVELGKTTLQRPDDWRRLIREVRGLYSGKLVYAANWGDEFERLEFWDELDYIGLNCYYPLSQDSSAGSGTLIEGAKAIGQKVDEVALRFDKPVLITEIGFTATAGCWVQPHEVAGRKPLDQEHQRKAYAAVFSALGKRPSIAGLYWWKWPTYLTYGGPSDRDFTPNGKPAEEEVRKYYRQMAGK